MLSTPTFAFAAAPFGGQASKGTRATWGNVSAAIDGKVSPGDDSIQGDDAPEPVEVPPVIAVSAMAEERDVASTDVVETRIHEPAAIEPDAAVVVDEAAVPAEAASIVIQTPVPAEPALVAIEAADARPEPVIVVVRHASSSRDGYLPASGPVALRFAKPREWPSARVATAAKAERASEHFVSESPAPVQSGERESLVPETPLSELVAMAEEHSETRSPVGSRRVGSRFGTTLTADLVLGYISDLSGMRAAGAERFVPATPAVVSLPAGVAGVIP